MKRSFVLTLVAIFVLSISAHAQKRRTPPNPEPAATQPAPPYQDGQVVQETICKGMPIPDGYVAAGETSTSDCKGGAWILKRRGTRLRPEVARQTYTSPRASRSRAVDEDGDEEGETDNSSRTSERAKDSAATRPVPERPSNTEVDDAVRQQRVLVGMTFQDVYRAWTTPRNKSIGVSEYGRVEIWHYRNARVYFAQERVVEVLLVQ